MDKQRVLNGGTRSLAVFYQCLRNFRTLGKMTMRKKTTNWAAILIMLGAWPMPAATPGLARGLSVPETLGDITVVLPHQAADTIRTAAIPTGPRGVKK
jgi:hypothetical protein